MSHRLLYLLLLFVVIAAACSDDDCPDERINLEDYIDQNNIDRSRVDTLEGTGLRYIIGVEGGEERPEVSDSITINYRGFLTNDRVFDQTTGTPRTFLLGQLIPGWQLGIPLIGRGGSITLFIPSELGYGSRQVGDICPDSDLIFEIDLLDFSN